MFPPWLLLQLLQLSVVQPQMPRFDSSQRMRCPNAADMPQCDCLEELAGLVIECHRLSQDNVVRMRSHVSNHIKSLHLYDLQPEMTHLPAWLLGNVSLTEFKVSRSSLKDVAENCFSGLERTLTSLTIQDSKLTYIPRGINKISTLRTLDLQGNNISELYPYSFYGASITHLNLAENKLIGLTENAFLGLEGNLKSLNLMDNRFKSFPMSAVKNLQNLEILNLVSNNIEDITSDAMSFLTSLQTLDFSFNKFMKILSGTLRAVPRIQSLTFSNNYINEIEHGSFEKLEELELLQLDRNRLVTIPSGTFRYNRRLRTLVLSNNHLRHVNGLLNDLPSLLTLDLRHNYLLSLSDGVFLNTPEIRTLNLEYNVIYEVADHAFKPLKKLNELHLSHNFLSKISQYNFQHNIALNSLSLDNNLIRMLDDESLKGIPKLEKLLLNDNVIREIRRELFAGQASLVELSLQNNKLTSLEPHAFSSLSSLQYLNIQGNRLPELVDIMMRYPSSLVSLYIEDNRLSKFDENSFSGQTSLELIRMGNNRIETIGEKLFFELINLFRLSLTNNRIEEIKDKAFEHCVQLRFLDLSVNKLRTLTKLTLDSLNQLEELNLHDNNIQYIEKGAFQSLHHLKQLDMSRNKLQVITEGAFHGCRAVHTLLLQHSAVNQIEIGALKPFSSLSRLDISFNSVSDLDSWSELEALQKLQVLQVSGNNLKNISHTITLQKFPQLVQVEFENCKISEVNGSLLTWNKDLKIIKLSGNYISRLQDEFFSKQVFLKELYLGSNHFTYVPGNAMKYLFNLKKFDISGNLLTELSDSSFDDVTALTWLDISNNLISLMSNRVFHNVTLLENLNLEGNRLAEFPASTFIPLTNLIHINVGHNQLQHIPIALQGLRQVATMNLSRNSIVRLKEVANSAAVMSTIKELYLTGTNMAEVDENDFTLCPNLVKLIMSDNKIAIIRQKAFHLQRKLEDLDLSGNLLIRLPSQSLFGLASLRTFNLSRNRLSLLDIFPSDLVQLKILDMSFNDIRALEAKVFHYLVNLVKLNLRGNKISQVSPDVFLAEQPLKGLDLRSNRMERIPYEAIDTIENSLEALHFEDNPIVCSCRSFHQKLWFRQNRKWMDPTKKNSKVGPQCSQPESLSERYLLTTKDTELCPLPSVSTFDIRNVTTNSVLIAWDSQDNNMTGLKGFLVAYHRLDMNDVVKKFKVNPSTRMFRLNNLMDDSVYLVCVITQGSSYSDYNYDDNHLFAEAIRLEEESEQFPFSDQRVLTLDEEGLEISPSSEPEIPSSNDTRYLITKPIVLNLDSQSSRCNKIKTPLDPSKLRMIDNKQMSALIGCSSGLMIFFFIIISIIVAKPKRHEDDEVIVPKSDSLTESYKSPSSKSRSESLAYDKRSYCNSQASSLTRLNGPDHEVRMRKESLSPHSRNPSESGGTLKKRSQNYNNRNISPQKKYISKQSSSESGPSISNKMSRQSSSDVSGGAVKKVQNRQSLEYLEMQSVSHSGTPGRSNRKHLETGYDQHTFPRGQQRQMAKRDMGEVIGGGSGSFGGTKSYKFTGGGPGRTSFEVNGLSDDCIPMIEYHNMNNSNHSSPQTLRVPREQWRGDSGGVGRPKQKYTQQKGRGNPNDLEMQKRQNNYNNHTDHAPGNEVEYYPDEEGANSRHGYIKYNSMAAAKY